MLRLVTRERKRLCRTSVQANRIGIPSFPRRGIYDDRTDLRVAHPPAHPTHPRVPDLHRPTINFSNDPRIRSTAKAHCGAGWISRESKYPHWFSHNYIDMTT